MREDVLSAENHWATASPMRHLAGTVSENGKKGFPAARRGHLRPSGG